MNANWNGLLPLRFRALKMVTYSKNFIEAVNVWSPKKEALQQAIIDGSLLAGELIGAEVDTILELQHKWITEMRAHIRSAENAA